MGYWRSEIAECHANQTILGFHSTAIICMRVDGLNFWGLRGEKCYSSYLLKDHIETEFVSFHIENGADW